MSPDRTEYADLLLRTLDPADATIDAALAARVDAALERILTADPRTLPAATSPSAPARRGHVRPRRLALLAGAATVMVGTAIAVPGLGGDAPAYASWTATPTTPTDEDTATFAAACRTQIGDVRTTAAESSSADTMTALAERRGDYVTVVLSDPALGLSGFCVYEHESGAEAVDEAPMTGGAIGGVLAPDDPRAIVEGAISQAGEGDSSRAMVIGRVGSHVAGVTLRSQGTAVTATVSDGWFVAWWPGRAFPDGGPQGPTGGGQFTTTTYDLTLRDGTVLRDVHPSEPTPPGEVQGEVQIESTTA